MAKKKVWLAVGGVALSSLLTVGFIAGLLPEKQKKHEHVFDEGNVVISATCTTEGQVIYTCTECGESEAQAIPASHVDKGGEGVCDVCKEIFVDTSTYEQVAVSETDLCVGSWYRVEYTPATDDSPGFSAALRFSNISPANAFIIQYHFALGPAIFMTSTAVDSLTAFEDIACVITDTYFDFCIPEPCSFIDPFDQANTYSILETSTWVDPDATGFYKLVP